MIYPPDGDEEALEAIELGAKLGVLRVFFHEGRMVFGLARREDTVRPDEWAPTFGAPPRT
jgi:hypothetical protein